MSIWPFVFIALLSGFFAWRRENLQRLFDPSRREKNVINNKQELRRFLDLLVDFLSRHEEFRWANILRAIRADLKSPATEAGALSRLSELFGGMSSLNDLPFD